MSLFSEFVKRLEAKTFLGEVIEDYGIVSEEKMGGAFQKTSLLLCKRRGKLQIVIRSSSFAYLSVAVKYEYIPASCASRLKAIMEDVETRSATGEARWDSK